METVENWKELVPLTEEEAEKLKVWQLIVRINCYSGTRFDLYPWDVFEFKEYSGGYINGGHYPRNVALFSKEWWKTKALHIRKFIF